MFPLQRGRRLRTNESIRSLVRETTLSPSDFMFPMFIAEGENVNIEIPSMPGIFRRSIDLTVEEVKELFDLGIRAVNIYVKVNENLKDNTGKEAWNKNGLMQQAIRAIKSACPEMIVIAPSKRVFTSVGAASWKLPFCALANISALESTVPSVVVARQSDARIFLRLDVFGLPRAVMNFVWS